MPEPCELEEGVEHIVSLCHFNSPYEFYLRIVIINKHIVYLVVTIFQN